MSYLNKETGLPVISKAEADSASAQSKRTIFGYNIMFLAIGFGIAFQIHYNGPVGKYDSRLAYIIKYNL